MFASEAIDPGWGMQAVVWLALVISIGANLMQMLDRRSVQKREVTVTEGVAKVTDLSALKADLQRKVETVDCKVDSLETKVETQFMQLRDEMREDKTEILRAGEDRAVKLHDRTNLILAAVSRLEGRIDK